MAQTSDQIRRELERTRERVGDTIAALEQKVNPRRVLDSHPLVLVGVAFGTGVLLATTGAARRTARDVGAKLQDGAREANFNAGVALDRILASVTQAAAEALTAKAAEFVDSTVRGSQPRQASTDVIHRTGG